MTIKRHMIHVKSNTPNKIPLSEDIKHGEIAINYANGNEKIYLRNENDVIQSIQTDLQNDAKFSTKQDLSGETQARINSDTNLNDSITSNREDALNKISQLSSITDSLQVSAETLTDKLNDYLPLTGGTMTGQLAIVNVGAPLNVSNTSLNTNLNADLLDGIHAGDLFTNLSNNVSAKTINATIGGNNKSLKVNYATNSNMSDSASTAFKTQGTLTLQGGSNGTFNGSNNTTVIIPSTDISVGTTGNVTTNISSTDSGITYNQSELQVVAAPTSSGYAKSYKLILNNTQLGETIDIPKNQFLSSVTYDETTKYLTFYMILQDGQIQTTNVDLSYLIDVYDSNNGIQKTSGDTGSTFSIKVKNIGNEFLGVDANGVYVTGVTTAINNAVATEANTRETNDNTLNNAITAETASRVMGDENNHNAITAETANRTTAINNAVATEANTRETNDNTLNNAITAETSNRVSAYNSLHDAITSETANRTNGDAALNNAITGETANRISADNTLHQEIQGITSVTHSVNSDYATNSGSATKLTNSRTIWGQSFDGSSNVDGPLTINSWSILNSVDNNFIIDRQTSDGTNGLIITKSGNVGIGLTYPVFKLHVNGGARFESDISVNGDVNMKGGTAATTDYVIDVAKKYLPINGNAVSATKLTTARNIWGQSFDGSGDVNGILSIEYGAYLHTHSMYGNKGGTILYNNGTLDSLIFSETGNGKYTFGYGSPGYLPTHNTLVLDVTNNRVGIGTVPGNFTLDVDGDTHINGSITALAFYESSDRTLKENIFNINEKDIKKSENVSLKEFNFKKDEDKTKRYGVIAQEVQEAGLENLVKENEDGKLSVDYISLLILKVSQLEKTVKELKEELNKR